MVLRQDVQDLIFRRGSRNECSAACCCSGRGCISRSDVTARQLVMSGRLTEQLLGLGWHRTFAGTYMLLVVRERVSATDSSPDRLSRFSSLRKARLMLIASCLAVAIRSSKKHACLRLWLRSASRIPRQCLCGVLPTVPRSRAGHHRDGPLRSSSLSARIRRMTANAQEIEN